jgi:hypothetical protein
MAAGIKPRKTTARPVRDRVNATRATDNPLPHERDESAGMTGGIASAPMQQAHRDLARGLQDTDRGPEADRTYRKLKQR